jgi:hypothetical protein
MTSVAMECGSDSIPVPLSPTFNLYFIFSSLLFMTITAIELSGFMKAVTSNLSRLLEDAILFAPGLMNLEK